MPDYKAAFEAASSDLSAIMSLLGFTSYPGVDPMLRAITNLTLAKAQEQALRQHKTDYMEAAEVTRRALEADAQALRGEVEALRARVVVVPERELFTKYLPGAIPQNADEVNAWKEGYNACHDDVVELNSKAVSEGLLRRIIQHLEWNGTQEQDITVMDYIRRGDSMAEDLRTLPRRGEGGGQWLS